MTTVPAITLPKEKLLGVLDFEEKAGQCVNFLASAERPDGPGMYGVRKELQ